MMLYEVFQAVTPSPGLSDIPVQCEWANNFKSAAYLIAGNVKGLALTFGPITAFVAAALLVLFGAVFARSRAGLIQVIGWVFIGSVLLGIVASIIASVAPGGCY